MKQLKKNKGVILTAVGILLTIVVAVLVVYSINKPKTLETKPVATTTPTPSAVPIEINQVATNNACSLSFVVADKAQPVCNESCNDSDLICPSDLECIYANANDTTGVCRLPSNPDSPTCTPADSSPTPSPSSTPKAELSCVVKRLYEDDVQNTAGVYYLNREILDTNTLTNGQVVVYNIVLANRGSSSVSDTTIDDVLSNNLTFMDASSGCNYDSNNRKVTCSIGELPGNTETSKSIRVKIAIAGTSAIDNRAEVYSTNGQRDICEITVGATGIIEQPPSPAPSALPEAGVMEVTTGTLSVGLLLLIAGGLGLLLL